MRTWNPVDAFSRVARNAPWVVMAIAIHLAVLIGLSIWYVAQEERPVEERPIVIDVRPPKEQLPVEEYEVEQMIRTLVPENKVEQLVAFKTNDFQLEEAAEPVEDAGNPEAPADTLEGNWRGSDPIGIAGPGGRRRPPGSGFGDRPGMQPPGGPGGKGPEHVTHEMVLAGLTWLARHQSADGSWTTGGLKEHCDVQGCADPKAETHAIYDEGVTSLAVLCFLGAGYSHESKQFLVDPVRGKRHRLGQIVRDSTQWLVERQKPDGSFTRDKAFLYNEALATMAVCEAYGLTRARYFEEPAQKAVDFLQRAQRPNPSGEGLWGWRYQPRSEVEDLRETTGGTPNKDLFDADTSVTTWCVMALKSAELAGLAVDPRSMDGAHAFIRWATADNGLVGYIEPKGAGATVTGKNDHFRYHPAVMSALGMCSRAFIAHDLDDPVLELSAKQVVADLPAVSKDRLSIDYYYWYYGSLALNQFDGPDSPRKTQKLWGAWNKAMVASLDELQNDEAKACHHGGWLVPDRWSHAGGPIYSTALAVLTLEVYYRYANAFAGVKRAR